MKRIILATVLALASATAFAQTKVSALTAASALDGTELVYCVQGSLDRKCTAAQFKTWASASPTLVTPALGTPASGNFSTGTFTWPTFNQSTTGSAATLTTARAIYGNNFDGSAALTQIIASTFGGTGNGFTKFTGPTTAERTFTLPDADATVLYSGGALGTPASGTATNLTGTAAGLTAGTVTTNANLTGDVTSSGNATTLATVNSNVGSFTNSSITVNAKGLITAASSGAAGATLGANSFTDTQTITKSIAATSTDGAVLQNTTAAAAGAQQWSPRLRLTGQGWKTTATAASQSVDWIVENVPVEGTTAPSSNLVFSASINGGAYSAVHTISSVGKVTVPTGTGAAPSIASSSGNVSIIAPGGGTSVLLGSNGSPYSTVGSYGSQVRSDGAFVWSLNTTVPGTIDTALVRNAAGVVEVSSNYTGGTSRDLMARHLLGGGTAPTVTGDGSSNGSIAGKDTFSKVTVGTGTTTSIVITFGTAYTNAPACVVNAQTTATSINVATTTTTATLTTTAFTAGEVLHVVCGSF